MSYYGIENYEESGSSGSDFFYYEDGYYCRVPAEQATEPVQTPVLTAA